VIFRVLLVGFSLFRPGATRALYSNISLVYTIKLEKLPNPLIFNRN
jgi:hypothetical protein